VISEGKNRVVAEIQTDADGVERCDLTIAMENVQAKMKANCAGIIELMDRFAEGGTGKLTASQFHPAGGDEIYRFGKGKLRLYCFIDDGCLVVCSHINTKKSQQTNPKDLKKAESLKTRYLKAKEGNLTEFSSMEDDK